MALLPMLTDTIMSTTEAALYRLMTWLSPSYPLGAFSYSHGLEYAVEAGLVGDRTRLRDWVATALAAGAGRSDGVLLAAAWRGAAADDRAAVAAVAELAFAWRGTAELALESRAQGAAFLATTRAAWPHRMLDELALRHRGEVALPVAVGVAAAVHAVPLAGSLTAYLHAFASNCISAGVRLIPLGQSDAQRAMAELESAVAAATAEALATRIEDAGTAAPLLEWCSMRHETQYTRLFRS
jgi:urease accessory protein